VELRNDLETRGTHIPADLVAEVEAVVASDH
jgi:hypothetical protein